MIFFQRIVEFIERLRQSSFSRAISKSNLAYASLMIVLLIVVGTAGFHLIEGWPFLDALYATIITITTVGYGDLSPQTATGRIFSIVFTLVAVGIAGYAISIVAVFVFDWEYKHMQHRTQERRMKQIAELQNHIIICGGGYIGKRVASEFYKNSTPFVVIEQDEAILRWTLLYLHTDYVTKRIRQFRELDFETYDTTEEEAMDIQDLAEEVGVLYLQEDPTHNRTLIRAGIERARGLISALEDDKDNLFVVLSARQLAKRLDNADLRIIARVVDEENTSKLYAAGASQVASPHVVGGFQMASNMLNPELGAFWNQMLYRHEGEVIRFMDLHIKEGCSLVGQKIASLKQLVKLVVALRRDEDFQLAPDDEMVLQGGDVLIVLGTPNARLEQAVST